MAKKISDPELEPKFLTNEEFRFSISRIKQNNFEFYVTSIPSKVLAQICFVTNRYEDPEQGFQRELDKKKAEKIAEFLNTGMGVIPSSIILSAQTEADIKIDRNKTIVIKNVSKAFLIIDGQHRVYGYKLSTQNVRIPVVIFNALSKQDEARLFIDINTKQSPVPNALLLDIKKLAVYENEKENFLSQVFEYFYKEMNSVLIGKMSKAGESKNKINRVTFYSAIRPLLKTVIDVNTKTSLEVFQMLNAYLGAFIDIQNLKLKEDIVNTSVFSGLINFFPEVARSVSSKKSEDMVEKVTYYNLLQPIFKGVTAAIFKNQSKKGKVVFTTYLEKKLKSNFKV